MNEFKVNVIIGGISELTAAINRLAGQRDVSVVQGGAAMQRPDNIGVPPVPVNPAQMGQPMPGITQPPVQMGPPVGQVPAQTPPPALTAAPVQGYTLEQLQVAAAGLMSSGKGQQIMGILQRFGIQAMTELPKERYGEFAMALREAGAQI